MAWRLLSLSPLNPLGAQTAPCSAIGDDGFRATGVCCAPATLALPPFPVFKAVSALYICVNNCSTSAACLEEDPLSDVKMQTVMMDCFCTPMAAGALPLHYHQDLEGMGTCPPSPIFQSIANLPNAPPTGFDQEYVGRWGLGAGLWPFKGHAWLANGVIDYSDITCSFPSLQPSFHFVWGGSTVNGSDDFPPSMALFGGPSGLHLMTDVVNSLQLGSAMMTQSPMVGTPVNSALLTQISR